MVSIFVASAENCFDVGHRGPEPSCCFEESESDCNGPPCAPACLPLRFATHLIRPAGKKPTAHSAHTHFKPRLSLLSHRLSFSLSFPSPYLRPLLCSGGLLRVSLLLHTLLDRQFLQNPMCFFSLVKTPNDAHGSKVVVLPLIVF